MDIITIAVLLLSVYLLYIMNEQNATHRGGAMDLEQPTRAHPGTRGQQMPIDPVHDSANRTAGETNYTNYYQQQRSNEELFAEKYSDMPLYEEPRENESKLYSIADDGVYRDILKGVVCRTPVSDMFFSRKNLDYLKRLICAKVAEQSHGKFKITPESQSDTEMYTIMRSIFLQYARHLPDNIEGQVADLNFKVLLDVVPRVLSAVQGELAFRRDHGSQPDPIERPKNVSVTGTRTNRPVTDLFI